MIFMVKPSIDPFACITTHGELPVSLTIYAMTLESSSGSKRNEQVGGSIPGTGKRFFFLPELSFKL
jgi:hypothetical protein